MNAVRASAFKMRIQGKSYNEINTALGVPKSTLSGWFSNMVLSDTAEARLKARVVRGTRHAFLKRNKMQTKHAEARAKLSQGEGKKRIKKLNNNDLLLIGAALYWAEGYKRLKIREGKERMDHKIGFVNADGQMIFIFIRFLQEVLKVPTDRIRVNMRLYPHINEAEALSYWMNVTRLPKQQFWKTTYPISSASKKIRPFNRLPWGTLQIEVCDTKKFHHILGLIEGVKAKL